MFDLIWILFIIITLFAITGILLMFKKILSSKKSGSSQDIRGRVEPGINDDLDSNEPQSVFNVRVVKADPQFDSSERFSSVNKQVPLPDYETAHSSNHPDSHITNTHGMNATGQVENNYAGAYSQESTPNQDIDTHISDSDSDACATIMNEHPIQHNSDAYEPAAFNSGAEALTDSVPLSDPSGGVVNHAPIKKGIWTRILELFPFRGRTHRSIQERPASEYVRRPKSVETIALILVAPETDPYLGSEIFTVIKNFDLPLIMGKDGFLEQVTTTYFGDEVEFSVANLIHPGSFDVPNVMQMKLPGILFFMDIPSPDYQKDTFDQMLRIAARFGNELGGTLLDQDKRPLTAQSVEALRHHIKQLDERLWFQAEFDNK